MLNWLTEPFAFDLMVRAFIEVIVVGVVAGFLGTFVVLKGMAFVGDAISHSVFPGVVIAFIAKTNLFIGGLAFGVLTALTISTLSLNRRIREDTAIGVIFAGFFALGIVLISTTEGYTRDLTSFLFGEVLAVTWTDVYISVAVGSAAVVTGFLLRRVLLLSAFDREMALSMGVPVFWLDTLLLVLITLAIVISLNTVGNILVLAMFVTPAATSRLLVDDVGRMMVLSPVLGASSGIVGLYISWYGDLAAGGTIVLTATAIFFAAFLFSPKQGVLLRYLRRNQPAPEAT